MRFYNYTATEIFISHVQQLLQHILHKISLLILRNVSRQTGFDLFWTFQDYK